MSSRNPVDAAALAATEKQSYRYVDLHDVVVVYLAAVLLAAATLFMPWNGAARGYDLALFTPASMAVGTAIPERMFVWGFIVFGIIGGAAVLALRLRVLTTIVWATTCITGVYGMFAIWIRQSRGVGELGNGPGVGLWLAFAALLLCIIALSRAVFRSSSSTQRDLAEQRRLSEPESELAQLQQQLMGKQARPAQQEQRPATVSIHDAYGIARPPRQKRRKRS